MVVSLCGGGSGRNAAEPLSSSMSSYTARFFLRLMMGHRLTMAQAVDDDDEISRLIPSKKKKKRLFVCGPKHGFVLSFSQSSMKKRNFPGMTTKARAEQLTFAMFLYQWGKWLWMTSERREYSRTKWRTRFARSLARSNLFKKLRMPLTDYEAARKRANSRKLDHFVIRSRISSISVIILINNEV